MTTGEKQYYGIISRKIEVPGGESLICVWHPSSPLKEYVFPRWSDTYQECLNVGEAVQFVPTRAIGEVQDGKNIWRISDPKHLCKLPEVMMMPDSRAGFVVKVHVSFPPIGAEYFKAELSKSKLHGCHAIGWCWEFGSVALVDGAMSFEPAKFYTGRAVRIDPAREFIAQKMGTLWILRPGSQLKEIDCPKQLEEYRQKVPWKHMLVTNVISTASGNFGSHNVQSSTSSESVSLLQQVFSQNDDDWSSDASDATVPVQKEVVQQQQPHQQQLPLATIPASNTRQAIDVGTEGIGKESVIFGKLVMHKLEWVSAHSQRAALLLQKAIMELCNDYTMRLLDDQQQQQLDNNNSNKHSGGRGVSFSDDNNKNLGFLF